MDSALLQPQARPPCLILQACGFVSEVDARLKLNTFILKNPPDNKLSKAEKK